MNTVLRPDPLPSTTTLGSSVPGLTAAELRPVQRAVAELRRGAPVVVESGSERGAVLVLAAEMAEPAGLAEFRSTAGPSALLVIARHRAAALFGHDPAWVGAPLADTGTQIAAYAVAPAALDSGVLRVAADPTLAQKAPSEMRALMRPVALPAGAEAAIQLAKIARLLPAALVAPVVMAADDLAGLLRVEAGLVAAYPGGLNADLRIVAEASVPLDSAPDARVVVFRAADGGVEHLAIVVGAPQARDAPLVRVHSACLTGDLFGSLRCDCGPQLRAALARMADEGAGVLLYLAQEGRGIGLVNKLRAYTLQDRGEDTVDANLSLGWAVDERSFAPAAVMLQQMGIGRVRLLTNNPAKLAALAGCGIDIAGREPHVMAPNGINDAYLDAKTRRLGHLGSRLEGQEGQGSALDPLGAAPPGPHPRTAVPDSNECGSGGAAPSGVRGRAPTFLPF